MLEDVGEHDGVEVAGQGLELLEIADRGDVERLAQRLDAGHFVFEAERAAEVIAHGAAELAGGGAEVEETAVTLGETVDEIDQDSMAAAFEILELIDVRHEWRRMLSVVGPRAAIEIRAGRAAVD